MGSSDSINTVVGIVVPTLGRRPDYLLQSLKSIAAAGDAYVLLVAPSEVDLNQYLTNGLIDKVVIDPGTGLANAINFGISSLPSDLIYVNWLGDDDLLEPNSINQCLAALKGDPNVVMVYGSCNYIDSAGCVIWKNLAGSWASKILRFGPDLIPQPGALFNRAAFDAVGGLDPNYAWAFDYDLFIKLSRLGKLMFIPMVLANFRWHPESLSVEFRKRSVAEASQVRKTYLPKLLRPFAWFWEFPIKTATLLAGFRVTQQARRLGS